MLSKIKLQTLNLFAWRSFELGQILFCTLSFILNLMTQENYKLFKIVLSQNDRKSVKSCSTASENEFNSPIPIHSNPLVSHNFRFKLFEASVQGVQISQKINQRAVSWLITFCWSKNLSQECLWLSVLLFYSCKVKKIIRKEDLQLTLLTCLSLSQKMLENGYYSPKILAGFCSKPFTASDIIEMEATILQIVDYNLVIPHQLSELMLLRSFQEEKLEQILMVCELLMMKDYDIFVNQIKLQRIIKRLEGKDTEDLCDKNVVSQVKGLLQLKQSKIILHKYSSKIDIELLKTSFF